MQLLEAQWIAARLACIPDEELFPLVDIGSSTLDYRTTVQPYIEEHVFAPLRARGGRVWHTDMKSAPGIDLVGDLLDPSFQARLQSLRPRTALVLNVLHHVQDPPALARALTSIVQPAGWVLVTGPRQYPRHFDPIDTMLRPTPAEIAALFPGSALVEEAILDSGNWRQWKASERGGRSLPRTLARLCVPMYRPGKWAEVAYQTPYLVKHITAFAALLRLR